MAYDEDQIAFAAEYALGTLDAAERAQVEAVMAADSRYAALVEAWSYKLGALNQMVGLVEPRAEVWDRIKAAITAIEYQAAAVALSTTEPAGPAPEAESPGEPAPTAASIAPEITLAAPDPHLPHPHDPQPHEPQLHEQHQHEQHQHALHDLSPAELPPAPANDTKAAAAATDAAASGSGLSPESMRVVMFAKQTYFWKRGAGAAGALAASLAVILGLQLYAPNVLPDPLRPQIRTRVVKVQSPAPPIPPQYVAVLQKDGSAPAFILTVDAGSKTFTVRRVAASQEPGKDYELWIVSDKLQRPRSLGVIGSGDFTVNPALKAFDAEIVNQATYAVTVEPEGGSPTGVATGPIVFTGKLVESVPQGGPPAPAPR
jgi:anti-sigma-K factor RskA